jgi:hypothetical protein
MRLVFVNHAHPDIRHVSGMRLGRFAQELARRGQQVALLTSALPGVATVDPSGPTLSKWLAGHDWRQPLVVAVPAVRRRTLELIRQNRVPGVLRRALTLWQFIAYGGVFADWQVAATRAAAQLAEEFRPEMVWGTFGNTTNLSIAQQLAHRAGCPWAMDIKDNWAAFTPGALRRPMAWRFRDASGWTSNSRHHQQVAQRWLRSFRTEVIYSGVADDFFERAAGAHEAERLRLLLVGGIYDDARLRSFLAAVRAWMAGLPPSERCSAVFTYAGSDSDRVIAALRVVPIPCATHVHSQLTISDVAGLATASFATAYLRASFTFHQKLLELLVCGRPLICYPGESAESKALASETNTLFASCETEAEVGDALSAAWARRKEDVRGIRFPPWRWADFAESLESFLMRCVKERQT